MRWIKPSLNKNLSQSIAAQTGLSLVVANILVHRGFSDLEAVEAFLNPTLGKLSDPLLPGQMLAAVERLDEALRKDESVLIFGDYDVDGVTSTTFLVHFLRRFGLNPRYVVPRRLEEGYGLTIDSLSRALGEGKPDLLIAVDCGTGSAKEVAWLREKGISVLILDHHTSKESLPQDCILVNPHVHDGADVSWSDLCSVGLVFKFCHAFLKVIRERGDALAENLDLREYLDLVALGTVADLVRLEGENRILVKSGLQRLKHGRRPGLCALMEVVGLRLGEDLSPVDIGFRLGPRINASGRLDDASLPIQLLLGEDFQACKEAARMLDEVNRERQDIEREITRHAEQLVEDLFKDDAGIIIHSPAWHTGVVGIVASRIARKYNRPTLVLGAEGEGVMKGSGRSIEGVNLVDILNQCTEFLQQWGGHPMAVGLSLEENKVDLLRDSFNLALATEFPDGLPEPALTIDAEVRKEDLSDSLLDDLAGLAPFGQGNPEPVFALRGICLGSVQPMGQAHVKFLVQRNGKHPPVEGVAWNSAGNRPPSGIPVDIAFRFHWNNWRGVRAPRLTLLDWRLIG